ncbi:MAG: hypothetical protein M1814_005256 [Vezdaea aestivalis]|nr:MAG: hypothetical protein M1814_005256 [Vezdaea aestivalis]
MNNRQFRNLVLDKPEQRREERSQNEAQKASAAAGRTPALGSRMRSSMPMTPRSVTGYSSSNDFARQLAARNATENPTKTFRSSAAPKGAKLPEGYTDRARDRAEATDGTDKETRIKALEDAVKLGQLDSGTFERLRDEIIGGDASSSYLVKGLDWKLLERVRRGEDVTKAPKVEDQDEKVTTENLDGELDRLEDAPVIPIVREQQAKKGDMAPPPALSGKKRNRDAILAELKAARRAAAEAKAEAEPQLGSKFKKVGGKQSKARIERDEKGREVLITVDENGKVKRKVRKQPDAPGEGVFEGNRNGLLLPDNLARPLGSDIIVPARPPSEEEESDGDIFEGVGAEYDPLGGISDDEDSDDSDSASDLPQSKKRQKASPLKSTKAEESKPPSSGTLRRNYFGTSTQEADAVESAQNPLQDKSFLASIAKASAIAAKTSRGAQLEIDPEAAAKAARRAAMLSGHDRDEDDLDMGFGSNRLADGEEAAAGDERVKLSVWGEDKGDDKKKGDRGGKAGRKRGPKKKKGDKNSANDVLKVMEQRKAKG